MYRLLTAFYEPYNENSRQKFWNFRLGQFSHVVLSHYIEGRGGERGGGRGVRENNVYCFFLRMATLLIFIHNGGI